MKKVIYEINSSEELESLISKAVGIALIKTNKSNNKQDEILTTEELCSWLKLSRVTVWHLTKNGILPFLRVGNQKRFLKSEVLNILNDFKYKLK